VLVSENSAFRSAPLHARYGYLFFCQKQNETTEHTEEWFFIPCVPSSLLRSALAASSALIRLSAQIVTFHFVVKRHAADSEFLRRPCSVVVIADQSLLDDVSLGCRDLTSEFLGVFGLLH
jgi:hypothetical protein